MAVMTMRINWGEKYFQQIDARLESIEYGQRSFREEVRADYARLDAKIDGGLREVRSLQWGTLALVATAVLGSLARIIVGI